MCMIGDGVGLNGKNVGVGIGIVGLDAGGVSTETARHDVLELLKKPSDADALDQAVDPSGMRANDIPDPELAL